MEYSCKNFLLFLHTVAIGLYSVNVANSFLHQCYFPCVKPYNYLCCQHHMNEMRGYKTTEVIFICCCFAPCLLIIDFLIKNCRLLEHCTYVLGTYVVIELFNYFGWVHNYEPITSWYVRLAACYFVFLGIVAYVKKDKPIPLASQDEAQIML